MIGRIYVEKKPGEDLAARRLAAELSTVLDIHTSVRILNRYDVEGLDEQQFAAVVRDVLSEPQVDNTYATLAAAEVGTAVFAVEYQPGQFDQRADSAAQCAQILLEVERPTVRSATVYALDAALSADAVAQVKNYVINPVESREAALEKPESLTLQITHPGAVGNIDGLVDTADAALPQLRMELGLAMDAADLKMVRDYFAAEKRDPTVTELKVIDTYWSDHCRHTTFNTEIDAIEFSDPVLEAAYQDYLAARAQIGRTKPITLMDMGTIGAKVLRAAGKLPNLDVSEEINACTVKIDVTVDGKSEPWLLLFKNETHNHPTEIEPFGGAATCIGGAIRDPLSGRGYVHAAMRITGAGDPRTPLHETLAGKLPQRKIVTTAAEGYSSYGNQIGLATGIVDEIYHPGYVAKRMELGAVVAAVPADQVRREAPAAGDVVLLVGGATGRDGIGGATGSSKEHTVESLTTAGAEVQKGNAPEERKLQRFFRNPEVARMIKRCNDFGAGGVAVAVGELTDGLDINLDAVPKKYDGLDGTEIALSESQERMALVVAAADVERMVALAGAENLPATVIAEVTDTRRLQMKWRGETIVDISREFLDTNGAEQHVTAVTPAAVSWQRDAKPESFTSAMQELVADLNVCSKEGLTERFDSTVGAGSVLMPLGGTYQETPIQAMAHLIPTLGETADCSVMAWGFNPYLTEASPYHGAYLAVVESVAKLVATGASIDDTHLSFQEYFERLDDVPERWGKPVAALLGALQAQLGLEMGSIGGKDSMSGTFQDLTVPPTLVSFAVTNDQSTNMVANHFKTAGNRVTVLDPQLGTGSLADLPGPASLLENFRTVTELLRSGKVVSAYTPGFGGIAEAVVKMSLGERLGFEFTDVPLADLFNYRYGSFVLEWSADAADSELVGSELGTVSDSAQFTWGAEQIDLAQLRDSYQATLETVYPTKISHPGKANQDAPVVELAEPSSRPAAVAKPVALIPVFPGTNCEYDTARALERAGVKADVFIVRNRNTEQIAQSVTEFSQRLRDSQLLVIPGGFSGGDEPDGSAKFITSFFRNPELSDAVAELLDDRGGLILGICNGFQALIKLGLVPFGKIVPPAAGNPTLTFNRIGRHQSRIARVRVANAASPWLAATQPGEVYTVPISHGEGRLSAPAEVLDQLIANGQIATQYVDLAGNPTMDIVANPNGSAVAIEGMTSPDGRVFGKMGHAERIGENLYRNVPGQFDMRLFESAVNWFNQN